MLPYVLVQFSISLSNTSFSWHFSPEEQFVDDAYGLWNIGGLEPQIGSFTGYMGRVMMNRRKVMGKYEVGLSVWLSAWLHVYLPACLLAYLCLSIYLSIYLSIRICLSMPVYIYVSMFAFTVIRFLPPIPTTQCLSFISATEQKPAQSSSSGWTKLCLCTRSMSDTCCSNVKVGICVCMCLCVQIFVCVCVVVCMCFMLVSQGSIKGIGVLSICVIIIQGVSFWWYVFDFFLWA